MATNTRIELTDRLVHRPNESSSSNQEGYYYSKFDSVFGTEITQHKRTRVALFVLCLLHIVIVLAAVVCLGLIVAERFLINDKASVSFVEHEEIKDLSSFQSSKIEKELDSLLYHSTLIDVSIQASIGEFTFPARSCEDLFQEQSGINSGRYWILNSDGRPVYVYCAKNPIPISNTASMMRVGYFNLDAEPNKPCPANFDDRQDDTVRTCGRCINATGCNSILFETDGVKYRRVCGKVIGYQLGTTNGFIGGDINGPYVDGVSLTYGKTPQRKHIWTFAGGLQEEGESDTYPFICPCANELSTNDELIPEFVGEDYFCESGFASNYIRRELAQDDPLWDGDGCELAENTCCSFNTPPWFCKDLPESTTEDIELRVCGAITSENEDDLEDTPIRSYEIYVN